eukprot:7196410-Prymnesium_polylepis.1
MPTPVVRMTCLLHLSCCRCLRFHDAKGERRLSSFSLAEIRECLKPRQTTRVGRAQRGGGTRRKESAACPEERRVKDAGCADAERHWAPPTDAEAPAAGALNTVSPPSPSPPVPEARGGAPTLDAERAAALPWAPPPAEPSSSEPGGGRGGGRAGDEAGARRGRRTIGRDSSPT